VEGGREGSTGLRNVIPFLLVGPGTFLGGRVCALVSGGCNSSCDVVIRGYSVVD